MGYGRKNSEVGLSRGAGPSEAPCRNGSIHFLMQSCRPILYCFHGTTTNDIEQGTEVFQSRTDLPANG